MSGIFDLFKPTNPNADNPGLIGRVARRLGLVRDRIAGTTEVGTSATASPAVEEYEIWQQRYDRRAVIMDIRKLILEDIRVARALWKMGREASRKGVIATVTKQASRGPLAGRAKRAQRVIDRTLKNCKLDSPERLRSWAIALFAEGDLFVQRVVKGSEVVDAKRMPASSMERCTDAQDRFFDVTKAFVQLDVNTEEKIAWFAAWQIAHERWNHWDGDRYGQSGLIQVRRTARSLQLLEQAQVIRRIARAALRLLHKVGTKENPAGKGDVEDYKSQNNLKKASDGGLNPKTALIDYFGNGNTEIQPIPGDPNLEKIEDLEYFQDLFAAGLGPPKSMLGLAAKDINRDILKDQIAEWLKEVQDVTDALSKVVRAVLDLALMLEGIDPATCPYELIFSVNSIESPKEIVDRVTAARQNTIGQGRNAKPDPLISRRAAVTALAEVFGFRDVDAMIEELKQEAVERQAEEVEAAAARAAIAEPDKPDEDDQPDTPPSVAEGDRIEAKRPGKPKQTKAAA